MNIKIYAHNSEYYQQELLLRNKILRKPLGLNLFDEDLNQDIIDIHIGVCNEEILIGVILLTPIDKITLKMRQVAVDNEYQGQGIGSGLVSFCEKYAYENGYKIITMHARKNVIGFYNKLGYKTIGEEFTEVSIPHFKMIKSIK